MPDSNDFLSKAKAPRKSLPREFLDFLRREKKWWLTPIVVTLVLLAVLVALGGTAAAPFIYTLF
jgi:hypothetical protein